LGDVGEIEGNKDMLSEGINSLQEEISQQMDIESDNTKMAIAYINLLCSLFCFGLFLYNNAHHFSRATLNKLAHNFKQ
jgi:hypothetical protein